MIPDGHFLYNPDFIPVSQEKGQPKPLALPPYLPSRTPDRCVQSFIFLAYRNLKNGI